MDIGKRIKKIRSDKGLTQKQLAKIAGVGEMTISQYERGVRQPKVEQLQRIVNVLGISMNQLLTDSEESFTPKKLREIAKEGHTDYFTQWNIHIHKNHPFAFSRNHNVAF